MNNINLRVTAVTAKLSELQPLLVVCIETERPDLADKFNQACEQNHYLKHRDPKGEVLRYMVYTTTGEILACLMFSHAAWNLPDREKFIGWNQNIKATNLPFLVNNSRFVIMNDVKVRNLATWILGNIIKRISSDWRALYNHPIYAIETFVDETRHNGSCYKAANWTRIGELKIKNGQKALIGSSLGIYILFLTKDLSQLTNVISAIDR